MSSVKIKKNKVFFVVLLENIRIAGARAHFMRYIFFSIQFNSIQFISFHFISIQRDENNETLRMITKITKKTNENENYEM